MKLKMNLLAAAAAAVAAFAAGSAHANFTLASQNAGNSSVAFVAIDNNNTISLSVDLAANMTQFLQAGNLAAPGTTASWNFAANTFTVNGSAVGGSTVNWTSPVASFFANASVGSTGYRWGVIAGDSVNLAASPTNVVAGQNILFTSSVPDFDNSFATGITTGTINNAAGNISDLFSANWNQGTHSATVKGAATATGGSAFLGQTLAGSGVGDFGAGGFGTNDFLTTGTTSYFMWANSSFPPSIYALGAPNSLGSLDTATAATFTWDAASSTLTYAVAAVPEPSTYAMLAAGLAIFGFIGRRRAR